MSMNVQKELIASLRVLLLERTATTQEEICTVLETQGFEINQSKVSRLLRKVGAVKVVNEKGETVYSLPREPGPPVMNASLQNLIVDVVSNEVLVVVYTSPGSASMVARVLDYSLDATEILGTIAGDDTIFIAPKSIKNIQKLKEDIKVLLNR